MSWEQSESYRGCSAVAFAFAALVERSESAVGQKLPTHRAHSAARCRLLLRLCCKTRRLPRPTRKMGNNRIRKASFSNQNFPCAPNPEKSFFAPGSKIVLQHNRSKTGHGFASQRNVAKGHVWTAPSWQGLSSRMQHWSVQPCVRPLSAVHMTAGHNALRGSGPGHKRAFKNALALVGCPDRRIDRLCITCCSPSQPSHHATVHWRDLVRPLARPDNCIARLSPSLPKPFGRAC